MSSTMSKIGARDLGTALSASSSSPTRVVNVADGSTVRVLSRLEAAVYDLTVSHITTWMEQLPPAKGLKKIPGEIFAQIIGFLGKPITLTVCKAWKEMTLESYHEILASYPQDPYSSSLLERATRRFIPNAGALTAEGYRRLDDVTCRKIFKNIQRIKDVNLFLFYGAIEPIFSVFGIKPVLPKNIHEKASVIRRLLSEHQDILGGITAIRFNDQGLGILPPEVGLLVNLKRLDLSDNNLKALPSEFGRLVNLEELNLAGNQFTARPAVLDGLPLLQTVNLQNNPIPA